MRRETQERPPTSVRGLDAVVLALRMAVPDKYLPPRWRGMPPLFHIPVLAGIACVCAFALFIISRLSSHGPIAVPTLTQPNAILVCMQGAMALLGGAAAIGTLARKQWGLHAAYLWFASISVYLWVEFMLSPERGAIHVASCSANTVFFGAITIYYRNRRDWFGYGARGAQ